MQGWSEDTLPRVPAPVVVVVAGSDELISACREVVRRGVPARIEPCDLANMSTVVARWKPYAIVVPEAILEFDAREFRALARDVHAHLVHAPEDPSREHDLADLLQPQLKRAFIERAL